MRHAFAMKTVHSFALGIVVALLLIAMLAVSAFALNAKTTQGKATQTNHAQLSSISLNERGPGRHHYRQGGGW